MGRGCLGNLPASQWRKLLTPEPVAVGPRTRVVACPWVHLAAAWAVMSGEGAGRDDVSRLVAGSPVFLPVAPVPLSPVAPILGTAVVVEVVAGGPLARGCSRDGEHTTKDDRTPHGSLQAYLCSALEKPPQ
jgi:hypothetical protein